MVRRQSGRRVAAILALTGWLGFAGGGDAAEFLAQTLGFHGACGMACCRERPDAACPRGTTTSHHGSHGSAPEGETPGSPLSISTLSNCESQCALQLGPSRKEGVLSRNPSQEPVTSSATGRSNPSFELPKSDLLSSVPARAPPA